MTPDELQKAIDAARMIVHDRPADMACSRPVCNIARAVLDLSAEVERLRGLLWDCRCDIWQTARANQSNINGVDPLFPDDEPCLSAIGNRQVTQYGVSESLALVQRVDAYLSRAALTPAPAQPVSEPYKLPAPAAVQTFEGWGILHPDGRLEMDYFNVKQFLGQPPEGGNRPCTPEEWRRQFRHDCKMLRVTVLAPAPAAVPAESGTFIVRDPVKGYVSNINQHDGDIEYTRWIDEAHLWDGPEWRAMWTAVPTKEIIPAIASAVPQADGGVCNVPIVNPPAPAKEVK